MCVMCPAPRWAAASNPVITPAQCWSLGLLLCVRRAASAGVAQQGKTVVFDATSEMSLELLPLVCSQGTGLVEMNVTSTRECPLLRGSEGATWEICVLSFPKHETQLSFFSKPS